MRKYIFSQTSNAPLVVFRILFGALMAISIIRFAAYGWIDALYINPTMYFPYTGFEWVHPLNATGMYLVFLLLFLSAIGIMLGWRYKINAVLFFILFTYVELIDKTNYLNHYYFISLISFLLIWLPAHRRFSFDVALSRFSAHYTSPKWTISIIKIQLGLVYFFAGLAKLNYDWLFEAMPLAIWLPAKSELPIIGYLFNFPWIPYVFSWSGAIYDLTIVFFLLHSKTRKWAYLAVVFFHVMTALLFNIGMFPYIMISFTLIYFSTHFHENILSTLNKNIRYLMFVVPFIKYQNKIKSRATIIQSPYPLYQRLLPSLLSVYLLLQICIPMRHVLYPGSVFWTEEGYRFSWRVMLMEKSGYTNFIVSDVDDTKREWVNNIDYLSPQQEKMMSTQPDMILQFAQSLEEIYIDKGFVDPKIYCYNKVSINGRRSKPLVDPDVNLLEKKNDFRHKDWLLGI